MLRGIYKSSEGNYQSIDLEEYYDVEYFGFQSGTRFVVDYANNAGWHRCPISRLYDDMSGYQDALQHETDLRDDELYVVVYYHYNLRLGELYNYVDFGVTKQEIITNVLANKYVEGADFYTMGQMFTATKKWLETSK